MAVTIIDAELPDDVDVEQVVPIPEPVPHLNVFPARVTVGENTWDKALLRTDGNTVEVWVENGVYPHAPIRAFAEEVERITNNQLSQRYPLSKQAADIETPIGSLHVQRQGGCGCGSKLRQLPPTRHQQQMQDGTLAAAIRGHFPNAQI